MAKISSCIKIGDKTIHNIVIVDNRAVCFCGQYDLSKEDYHNIKYSRLNELNDENI